MMIERVDKFKWVEGTEEDFKIEEAFEEEFDHEQKNE